MLDDKTKNRLSSEAAKIARELYKNTPANIYNYSVVVERALEAEAERNSGLVECLREMENHPMTAHYVKTKITHTLNQYNKP